MPSPSCASLLKVDLKPERMSLQTSTCSELFTPFFAFFISQSVQKLKICEDKQRERGFKTKGPHTGFYIPRQSLDWNLVHRAPAALNPPSLSLGLFWFLN